MKKPLKKKRNRIVFLILFYILLVLSICAEYQTLRYIRSISEAHILPGSFIVSDEYKDQINTDAEKYIIFDDYAFANVTTTNLATQLRVKDVSYEGDTLVVTLKDISPYTMGGCAITYQYLMVKLRKPVKAMRIDVDEGHKYDSYYGLNYPIVQIDPKYMPIIIIGTIVTILIIVLTIFMKTVEKQIEPDNKKKIEEKESNKGGINNEEVVKQETK